MCAGFSPSQIPKMKNIINFLARGVKVLLIDPGLRRDGFFGARRLQNYREAPRTTLIDRLDIFPDAIDPKITLVAFVFTLPAPRGPRALQ